MVNQLDCVCRAGPGRKADVRLPRRLQRGTELSLLKSHRQAIRYHRCTTTSLTALSGIQPAHSSSEQTSVVTLYHNAVVLALALASMLNGLLARSAAASAQPLCSSSACFHLSEPNGLFALGLPHACSSLAFRSYTA